MLDILEALVSAESALATAVDRYQAIGFFDEDAFLDDISEAQHVEEAHKKISATVIKVRKMIEEK